MLNIAPQARTGRTLLSLGLLSLCFLGKVSAQSTEDAAASETSEAPAIVPAAGRPTDAKTPHITSVTVSGDGCPPGSWELRVDDEGAPFLSFWGFELTTAAEQKTIAGSCLLSLRIAKPAGSSVSLAGLNVDGWASLAAGATVGQTVRSWFVGTPNSTSLSKRELKGPHDDVYLLEHSIPTAERGWSSCGTDRPLMIDVSAALNAGGAKTGEDFVQLGRVSKFRFELKPCP